MVCTTGLEKMFNLWVVLNILKLWDALYKVMWNLIRQFLLFSYVCLFLACNWQVTCKCCDYLCYRVLTTHWVLHMIFCYLIVAVSLVVVDTEVKLLLKDLLLSLALFPGFCMKELNLLTYVSVQPFDATFLPSIRHSILRSDRIFQELWKLWTR